MTMTMRIIINVIVKIIMMIIKHATSRCAYKTHRELSVIDPYPRIVILLQPLYPNFVNWNPNSSHEAGLGLLAE